MLIGHFTEQPWQDDSTGLMGTQSTDLGISNGLYNPKVGAQLYNRNLDEKAARLRESNIGSDSIVANSR